MKVRRSSPQFLLHRLERIWNLEAHKIRAYRRNAAVIRGLGENIDELTTIQNQLRLAGGVGAGRGARFLSGKGLRVGDRVGCGAGEGGDAAVDESGIGGIKRGKHGHGKVGFGEVEGGGHVAHGGPTPRGEIRNFGAEASFEKAQHGGVVEGVG